MGGGGYGGINYYISVTRFSSYYTINNVGFYCSQTQEGNKYFLALDYETYLRLLFYNYMLQLHQLAIMANF